MKSVVRFNGIAYSLLGTYTSKPRARERARQYRRAGHQARVWKAGKRWGVYVHREEGGGSILASIFRDADRKVTRRTKKGARRIAARMAGERAFRRPNKGGR